MKPAILMLLVFVALAVFAITYKEKPDKYPITYVAISPVGCMQDVTYICGDIRHLPNGRVRCIIRYVDGQPSKDSVDFASTTQIIPADIYFIK